MNIQTLLFDKLLFDEDEVNSLESDFDNYVKVNLDLMLIVAVFRPR